MRDRARSLWLVPTPVVRRVATSLLAGVLGAICVVSPAAPAIARPVDGDPVSRVERVESAASPKRGIAYDLAVPADLRAIADSSTWWYNWSPTPHPGLGLRRARRAGMEFVPMIWGGDFRAAEVIAQIRRRSTSPYLLVMNEPNLVEQANLTPRRAAAIWPRYERVARKAGVKIVGPQITWGTMAGYEDPVVWLDAFYAAYRSAHGGRDPRIDHLGFHWYDYGLAQQLDRLRKYGKPLWVTELANWHSGSDTAQIDTPEKQKAQMTEMVDVLESRDDVVRYAWFTGRWEDDAHFTSLLAGVGELTELGRHYASMPYGGG